MATFVLVHGAFSGGWYWRATARALRQYGHDVYTPTLTGLGERVHLAHPDVTLDTHILDITHLLFYEDLTNVYLVGKSYAGMVITGVADRAPERIGHLIYLDSPVPAHGQALADFLGPETMAFFVTVAREEGDGWRVPASVSGITDSRLTPMPLRAGLQPLHLTGSLPLHIHRTYICCTADKSPDELQTIRAHYQRAPDWHYVELASNHEPEQTMPDELAIRFHTLVQM